MQIDEKDISIARYAHQLVMLADRMVDLTNENAKLKEELAVLTTNEPAEPEPKPAK